MKDGFLRLPVIILCAFFLVPTALVSLYRFVPPPLTPLMLLRTLGYGAGPKLPPPVGWHYHWVPLEKIAPSLPRAVIAAEDATFCSHMGFDRKAFNEAWDKYRAGRTARGGSTITQQTAKNVFLWPGRSIVRKIIETGLTPLLELIWHKPRIMEVYLNVVEWAPGVYGAEAASRFHFNKSAAELTPHEAALLASVLPSPRKWSASKPGPYVQERSVLVGLRAGVIDASCLK
jgi:monofunctional biosynthetic peptidoglycan transglycosylase